MEIKNHEHCEKNITKISHPQKICTQRLISANCHIDSPFLILVVLSIIKAKFWNCYTNTIYLWKYLILSTYSKFIFVIFVNIYIFVENLLKWIKKRENRNDILNSQVLLIKKNHVRTFFNVKLCDTQQPIRYFKLFANWYIKISLTDFWEKVNSVQQLQN